MNKTISYKESTAIAIQAMMSAARKDEYADRKRKSNLRVGVNSLKTERNVMSLSRTYVNGTKEGIIKKTQESQSTR